MFSFRHKNHEENKSLSRWVNLSASFFMLLSGLFFTSCKKDTKKPDPDPAPVMTNPPAAKTYWLIDTTDKSIVVRDFKSGKGITSDYGITSNLEFDVNGDSISDLMITMNVLRSNGGLQLDHSWVRFQTIGNTYILTIPDYVHFDHIDSANLSSRIKAEYPKVLSYKDTIKINDRWSQGNLLFSEYSEVWVGGTAPGSHYNTSGSGEWRYVSEKYMAIKCNNKIAWIKLMLNNDRAVTFFETAWVK